MPNKTYHHGDLENALIEAGIAFVNEEGPAHLSLRKLAARCGVSHTAPYSHFADKDALIEAMKAHVSTAFATALQRAWDAHLPQGITTAMLALGKAYVDFFHAHPQYYEFIFQRADFDINLDDITVPSGYAPFDVFRSACLQLFESLDFPKTRRQQTLIKLWATVHGLAGICVMQGITFSDSWTQLTEELLGPSSMDSEKG